jgi:hypothetical protein
MMHRAPQPLCLFRAQFGRARYMNAKVAKPRRLHQLLCIHRHLDAAIVDLARS